jgi:hypothetical protein
MASLEGHKVFDKSKLPTDYTKEIVTEVNSVIERLRALLVPRIVVSEPPLGLTVPNLVRQQRSKCCRAGNVAMCQ